MTIEIWIIATENGVYGIYNSEMEAKAHAWDIEKSSNFIQISQWSVTK